MTSFDIAVIGAGHAGCEAALACARMGCTTILITINNYAIAQMSCNPAIGGIAKGQIVREIDALGGEMAKAIDTAGIQFRMLNTTKGEAVWSPRAQADKEDYMLYMRRCLEEQENLFLFQDTVTDIIVKKGRVAGIKGRETEFQVKAAILCTGTFLNGVMHIGREHFAGGRLGEPPSLGLVESIEKLGHIKGRLKTGTPPRVHKDSIDFTQLTAQHGDEMPVPFSFSTKKLTLDQVPCHITYTNDKTKKIITDNLDKSALYSGNITGIGPRYCPSLEDKIVKFTDRDRHQVFIEPEGRRTKEMYLNGISSSLPFDIQAQFVHSIEGLEKAWLIKPAYAIEYDFFDPKDLRHTLESKHIENLFFAGQINGTSGYEEAAGQGLTAAVNAAAKLKGLEPLILRRDESYIGVMIDDLVSKGVDEPYRMFTAMAEYRILLRQDNADRRLMIYGHAYGLIPEKLFDCCIEKERIITEALNDIEQSRLRQAFLDNRPDIEEKIPVLAKARTQGGPEYQDIRAQIYIDLKYEPYIQRHLAAVKEQEFLKKTPIPSDFNPDVYEEQLRRETRDKLKRYMPKTLKEASDIPGITPADIQTLAFLLRKIKL